METLLSPQVWLWALAIFGLRVVNISLDTVRFLLVLRGKKLLTWILGFIQSIMYVVVISEVLSTMDNVLNIVAYAAGYSTGTTIGMWIEKRLAIGHVQLNIVSTTLGSAVAAALRANGFAVTEVPARGKDGTVTLLHADVNRNDVDNAETVILEADPTAFITAEDVRPMRAGFWRSSPNSKK